MKSLIVILLTAITMNGLCQTKRPVSKVNQNRQGNRASTSPSNNQSTAPVPGPDQTVTDRYLNGNSRGTHGTDSSAIKSSTTASPFVGGIHAGTDASPRLDSAVVNKRNVNNQTTNTTIPGGNDTTFNANTISQGGVTTISGAVDRSGQSQFGQTNWGNSRGTVGESQWTVPPPITASFNKEFPASNAATWVRNNVDTTIYSARYKSGAQWVTTNYNVSGRRLDTRTEFPLLQPPRPVSVYMAKQPAAFQVETIYKLQVGGKPDVYEIRTRTGKTVYVNNDGMEVNY